MHCALKKNIPTLVRILVFLTLLLCGPVSCSPSQECKGGISNLTLNAQDSLCADDCDCNNQLYEGLCTKGTCTTRKREACATPGAQRPCSLLFGARAGTCTDGIQTCQPKGITSALWGDCKAQIVPEEGSLCQDGKDNDCDGKTDFADEGCPGFCGKPGEKVDCYTGDPPESEGVGACRRGIRTCQQDGKWSTCTGQVTPKPEECNGIDDDCDGKIDTGLANCDRCQKGQTRTCYSAQFGCTEKDGKFSCQAPCRTGQQACLSDGFWGPCEGERIPQPEACNGKDDDCDGEVDEGPQGKALSGTCYPSGVGCFQADDSIYACLGTCRAGTRLCKGGKWESQCQGATVPQAEVCDGKDNDCDGAVDEDLTGPPCEKQAGVCTGSNKTSAHCKDGKWTPCADADYKAHNTDYSPTETCDGKDNDCNFDTDEDILGCVVTIAGTKERGDRDGPARTAQFSNPASLAIGKQGELYIADSFAFKIRLLRWVSNLRCGEQKNYTGYCVSTFAGTGFQKVTDGPRAKAEFQDPTGLAFDSQGNLYISDSAACRIRKIDTKGVVTTIAGDGTRGFKDGPAASAHFDYPYGIAIDPTGTLYIADFGNSRIRKLQEVTNAPCGTSTSYTGLCVSTLAGDGTRATKDGPALQAQFMFPAFLALDQKTLLVAGSYDNTLRKLDLVQGVVSTHPGTIKNPNGMVVDPIDGSVYIADYAAHQILKLDTSGKLTTIAGTPDTRGYVDGPKDSARFAFPNNLALDSKGYLYITESASYHIRRLKVR